MKKHVVDGRFWMDTPRDSVQIVNERRPRTAVGRSGGSSDPHRLFAHILDGQIGVEGLKQGGKVAQCGLMRNGEFNLESLSG
jgi:hypothetical protein